MAAPRIIPTSRPPDVVTHSILIGTQPIPTSIPVLSITINREVNKIPTARIRISDGEPSESDFAISNEAYFIPGKEIEIKFGYRSDNVSVFKGVITGHSNKISSRGSELLVECKDKAFKLTIGKKGRHFENMTDSDIAEEIIEQYNLSHEVQSTNTEHKHVVQFNSTDWDFIISRMDVVGKLCTVEDGKLFIKSPDLSAEPVLDLLYGATILDYHAEIDCRNQYTEVKSKSWHYADQEVVEESGDEPDVPVSGNLSTSDLAEVGSTEPYLLPHSGLVTGEMLREWASAKMQKSRMSKIRGSVRFQGVPNVKPGTIIKLSGVGERFNGPVFVCAVKHECSSGNWTTEATFGLPASWFTESIHPHNLSAQLGLLPAVQGLQIGIVTDLEDPESENRVKVKLPIISMQEEGVWMRIATLDAGNNRGTFFRPEIDDEVIVGFIFNDPNNPIILGMLNSSSKPAPLEAANENHEKGYVSRAGIRMLFNDDDNSYVLETPGGKKVTLDDNGGLVKIEDENGNKMTMESGGVTIESATSLKIKAAVDISLEAVNINLKPSSQFSVSAAGSEMKAGGGSAELKAPMVKLQGSGLTEIKGGIVMIN